MLLKKLIRADLFRYFGSESKAAFLNCFFRLEGFRYTYFLRKCRFYRENRSFAAFRFYAFLLKQYKYRYGFDIPVECEVGPGIYICNHFGGMVINPDVRIGANVNFNHGVTIGQTNRGGRAGAPVLGDRVWLGAYSIIVGKIRVGNNVLIGPGAYVNFDVPDNAVVLGNPGKIVSYKGTDGYLNNIWEENK
ncbi:MAG: serine O-acetyltransferase [Deltaproteobacteria bacterium]